MHDLRRLLTYLKPHWGKFTLATFAMLAGAVLQSAIGALIVPIFDQAFRRGGEPERTKTLFDLQHFIPESSFDAWRTIAILLIAFTLAKGVAEYFSTYLMARIGQESVLKLRQDLYTHLLTQSADFFERHRTNYLVSRLVSSAAAIEAAVTGTLRDMLRESFTLIAFLSASFYYSWRLTLGSLLIEPLLAAPRRDMRREGCTLIAFLSASFYYSWRLTLGSLLIAPIIGVLTAKFGKNL